jgi:hypothetical protein
MGVVRASSRPEQTFYITPEGAWVRTDFFEVARSDARVTSQGHMDGAAEKSAN